MRGRITTITGVLAVSMVILVAGCATPPRDTAPGVSHSAFPDRHPDIMTATPGGETASTADQIPAPEPPATVYDDVWDRIRAGFRLPPLHGKYVDHYQRWHQARPEYLERLAARARPYLFFIVEELERRDMPMEIALLPAIESAFDPTAYSRAGASGLWQFIAATGKRYGLKQNWWYDGRRDVMRATVAALDYLEFLHEEFDGDWFHALAAYNAGEQRVRRAIRRNIQRSRSTHYSNLALKSETQRYVPKLVAFKNIVQDPARFGLRLPAIPNQSYFTAVDTRSQIDLAIAGRLARTSLQVLRRLNPGFKRWATDPDGPHELLVPIAQQHLLVAGIETLPAAKRLRWTRYLIRPGDTLGGIARRHGLTVSAIQTSNRLKSTRIHAGRTLLLPISGAAQDVDVAAGNADGPTVHRVRNGDTLWGIAKRYNVYVKQLARWNAIAANDMLHLGQKIVVYR